jgi:hypothetical protein
MISETCEAVEQEVAQVLVNATLPYAIQARARALRAMTASHSENRSNTRLVKRIKGTRRLFYATGSVVILVALAAIAVLSGGGRADAFTTLAQAARAAERSSSVRIVRGPADRVPPGTPLTFTMSGFGGPGTDERMIAVGPHSIRRLDMRDGILLDYLVEDADTGEYAFYHRRTGILYTADLRPLQSIAIRAVTYNAKEMWKSELFEEQLALLKRCVADKTMQESVTDGVYTRVQPMQLYIKGKAQKSLRSELHRTCRIVTISWMASPATKQITSRVEFYLDPETKRPFAERQYLKIAGQPELMIGNISEIEYDVPFPPINRVIIPSGTKSVKCTVRALDIKNNYGHAIGFELWAGGKAVTVATVHVTD